MHSSDRLMPNNWLLIDRSRPDRGGPVLVFHPADPTVVPALYSGCLPHGPGPALGTGVLPGVWKQDSGYLRVPGIKD